MCENSLISDAQGIKVFVIVRIVVGEVLVVNFLGPDFRSVSDSAENNVFFDILAEDLARRDMDDVPIDESNYDELASRIDAYISEFEEHGTDNILVDIDTP